jgi:hypothetical protein
LEIAMSTRRSALVTGILVVALAGSACSDATQPLAPNERAGDAPENLLGWLGGVVSDLLVNPVDRTTPLPADVTWTFTAGPAGAVSSNSAVGLTITIPPGALASSTTLTVTALAGSPVAYRFEPHVEFERGVYLTQRLSGTNAGLLLPLVGGHFATDLLELDVNGLLEVTEIVPSLTNIFARNTTFRVSHFSGWVLASGRSGDGSDDR